VPRNLCRLGKDASCPAALAYHLRWRSLPGFLQETFAVLCKQGGPMIRDPSPESIYSAYKLGLRQLINRLGKDHPHYAEVLVYQQRLAENLASRQQYGDSEENRAARSQVIEQLNLLALDALGLSFNDLCTPDIPPQNAAGTLSTEVLHERFLRAIVQSCRGLSLNTVDRRATGEYAALLHLDAVFTALDVLAPREREGVRCVEEPSEWRMPVMEALTRWRHLVLLGDAGSGKSTLISFLALALAGEGLGDTQLNRNLLGEDWKLPALVPLRVILRDYVAHSLQKGISLWEFVCQELELIGTDGGSLVAYAPFLRRTVEQGNSLLLLDGLDEVPEGSRHREQVKAAVEQFCRDFPHSRVLVTARPYAYQNPIWQLTGFEVRKLAPFSPVQVQAFIERWYGHLGVRDPALRPDTAARYATQLKREVQHNARLAELAANPLLLTLMASLHRWQEGGALPEKRWELYDQSVVLLLDLWQRAKQCFDLNGNPVGEEYDVFRELGVPQERLRRALERLAYEAHRNQPVSVGTADITVEKVVAGLFIEVPKEKRERVQPGRIAAYLRDRAGILLERQGGQVFTFPHRTFQEYLAACWLQGAADYPDSSYQHLLESDDRWREVVLLALAQSSSKTPAAFWRMVMPVFCPEEWPEKPAAGQWYAVLRAAEALVTVSKYREEILNRDASHLRSNLGLLRRRLAALLEESPLAPAERAAAGRALALLGDPRPGVGVIMVSPSCGDERTGPGGKNQCVEKVMILPDLLWIEVPAGPFLMGSVEYDPHAYDDEKPQHEVLLPSYYITRYPITNAQFQSFVQDGGYSERRYWLEAEISGFWREGRLQGQLRPEPSRHYRRYDSEPRNRPMDCGMPFVLSNHPMVGVTWYEALAYCRWLTERLRETGQELQVWRNKQLEVVHFPLGGMVRLPTEAEWEKAARGPGGLDFPWGDGFGSDKANTKEAGIGSTTAVGCFCGASPYEAQDMGGNVWEWVSDWYGSYEAGFQMSPEGPPHGTSRMLRGGSWHDYSEYARTAYRNPDGDPLSRASVLGFRCVLSPTEWSCDVMPTRTL